MGLGSGLGSVNPKQLIGTAATAIATLLLMMVIQVFHADGSEQLLTIPGDTSKQEVLLFSASDTSSPILLSDDSSFSWQFVPYQNNTSRLLSVISTAYNTTIVWIANRIRPVSPNASLLVQLPSRTLLLRDANGSVAWSSPVAGVGSILMNSTGNLIMYDTHNVTIWQSFDDASDVLVTGQTIRINRSVSSRLSRDDVSVGHYSLRVGPGGAVMYASFDWQQQMVPYGSLAYAGLLSQFFQGIEYDRTLHSTCNHTILLYRADGSGVDLQQEGSVISPECREELAASDGQHSIDFSTRLGGTGFRYLRLMPYGDVVSFLSTNQSADILDNQFFGGKFLTLCRLPSYCGRNSLCATPNNCSCPNMFEQIGSGSDSGCKLVEPLNCSFASQHQFLALQGVDYYANAYLAAPTVNSSDACQSLCLANCSCTTAFYHNTSGACHLYDQVQTMQPGSDPSITVYLRVAKLPITNPQSGGYRISRKLIAGLSSGIAVMLVLFVLFAGWIGRRIMVKPDELSDSEEETFLESLPGLPPRYSYKELHFATEGFSKKLGVGGSGAVYEGQVPHRDSKQTTKTMTPQQDNTLLKVAVKELQLSKSSTSGKKQFRAEVATLGSLSHVNLVQLRGFCAEGIHRLLIYEFLESGSLDRWIFMNSVNPLRWEVRYQIAIDTARGLAFLHDGSRDKVLHLDVKPQNILLDVNMRAKLADFGLSKLVGREAAGGKGSAAENAQTVTVMRGTPGYMAPESFLRMPITDKSDVFSYGMVLLELVGGRKNLSLAARSEDEWYFPAWAVRQAENGNLLGVIDMQLTEQSTTAEATSAMGVAMSRLLNVAFWCIQQNAGARPSMTTVLLMLEEHLQVPDPPLDRTYILRHQSRPVPNATSTSTTSTGSIARGKDSAPASGLYSGMYSELEPR